MPFAIIWFGASLLVGYMGRGRSLGFWGSFLLAALVSPLVTFVILIATRPKPACPKPK